MNERSVLENFTPFNEMQKFYDNNKYVFANCSYDAQLTLAKHFKLNVLPLLINPIFLYEYNEDLAKSQTLGFFRIQVINVKSFLTLHKEMGIAVNPKSPEVNSLKREVVNSISNGCPVGICIDMFYQPERREFYHKQHGPGHYLLIYGYDLNEDVVYTVDDVSGLNNYSLSFGDLQNCYNGLFESGEYTVGKTNVLFEYSLKPIEDEGSEKQDDAVDSYIHEFIHNMLFYKDKILKSLDCLNILSEIYEDVAIDDVILSTLHSTLYRKVSEHFRIIYLYKYGFDVLNIRTKIDALNEEVVNKWRMIDAIMAKAIKSRKFNREVFDKSKKLIKEIYTKESEYYELLFLLLDAHCKSMK